VFPVNQGNFSRQSGPSCQAPKLIVPDANRVKDGYLLFVYRYASPVQIVMYQAVYFLPVRIEMRHRQCIVADFGCSSRKVSRYCLRHAGGRSFI
ncbi:hypothetical protein ACSFCW_27695, partial [Yokenella regensburgei]|uniref:hypothetical protein n=1 Tax=Yokenella regensburgei TaxID=158877 RepID=UPI003EDAC495